MEGEGTRGGVNSERLAKHQRSRRSALQPVLHRRHSERSKINCGRLPSRSKIHPTRDTETENRILYRDTGSPILLARFFVVRIGG